MRALAALGVGRGDIVAVIMPSIPEVFYLVYALSYLGATANMIDVRYPTNGLCEQIELTRSKVLFAFDGAIDRIMPIVEEGAFEKTVLVSPSRSIGPRSLLKNKAVRKAFLQGLGKKEESAPFPHLVWDEFIAAASGREMPAMAFEPNTPVVAVSTGGTTGTPKKVLLTNENTNSSVSLSRVMGLTFIAYGLVNGLHLPLSMGMEVILVPDPNDIIFDMELLKYKPNHVTGAANHWEDISCSPLVQKESFGFLLDPTCGGDSVAPTLETRINEFFATHGSSDKLRIGYGLTECCGGASQVIPQSVGFPFPESIVAAFKQADEGSFAELPYAPEAASQEGLKAVPENFASPAPM